MMSMCGQLCNANVVDGGGATEGWWRYSGAIVGYGHVGNIRYCMIFVPYKIGNRPCKFENRHIRYYMAAKFEYRPIFEVSCARSTKQTHNGTDW